MLASTGLSVFLPPPVVCAPLAALPQQGAAPPEAQRTPAGNLTSEPGAFLSHLTRGIAALPFRRFFGSSAQSLALLASAGCVADSQVSAFLIAMTAVGTIGGIIVLCDPDGYLEKKKARDIQALFTAPEANFAAVLKYCGQHRLHSEDMSELIRGSWQAGWIKTPEDFLQLKSGWRFVNSEDEPWGKSLVHHFKAHFDDFLLLNPSPTDVLCWIGDWSGYRNFSSSDFHNKCLGEIRAFFFQRCSDFLKLHPTPQQMRVYAARLCLSEAQFVSFCKSAIAEGVIKTRSDFDILTVARGSSDEKTNRFIRIFRSDFRTLQINLGSPAAGGADVVQEALDLAKVSPPQAPSPTTAPAPAPADSPWRRILFITAGAQLGFTVEDWLTKPLDWLSGWQQTSGAGDYRDVNENAFAQIRAAVASCSDAERAALGKVVLSALIKFDEQSGHARSLQWLRQAFDLLTLMPETLWRDIDFATLSPTMTSVSNALKKYRSVVIVDRTINESAWEDVVSIDQSRLLLFSDSGFEDLTTPIATLWAQDIAAIRREQRDQIWQAFGALMNETVSRPTPELIDQANREFTIMLGEPDANEQAPLLVSKAFLMLHKLALMPEAPLSNTYLALLRTSLDWITAIKDNGSTKEAFENARNAPHFDKVLAAARRRIAVSADDAGDIAGHELDFLTEHLQKIFEERVS